jgi:hypothetical protein
MKALLALCTAVAAVALVPGAGPSATRAALTATHVASGLDNPRGIAITSNGAIYVAEGGHGGDVCSPATFCLGTTSQISRVDPKTGAHRAVVTGLYSRSVVNEGITGVDGLAALGGRLVATMTAYPEELDGFSCASLPADCATVLSAARAQAGQLISFTPAGTWKALAGSARATSTGRPRTRASRAKPRTGIRTACSRCPAPRSSPMPARTRSTS